MIRKIFKPMKHTYQISGMSCKGCQTHVQKTLSEVVGVENVEVNLDENIAVIEMDKHISLSTLQDAMKKDGGK